ncbi:MAG: ABC transporter ATP-binding protein [Candidatus Saccharimonadales bacterium]
MFSPKSKVVLKVFWHHVWNYPKYVIWLLILLPITVLEQNYLPPLIIANVINKLSTRRFTTHNAWSSFGPEIILYALLLFAGSFLFWRTVDQIMWRLEANVERDIARRVFNHLLNQSVNFHANTFGGSLVSKTNKLMSSYIRFADTTVFQVIPLISGLIITVVILAPKALTFAVIFLLVSLAYIVISLSVTKRVRHVSELQANAETTQTGYLADAITNVMAVKSFAGLDYENSRFAKVTANTRDRTLDIMREQKRQLNYLSSVSNIMSAAAIVMAVVGVVVFKSNLATVYLILTYTASAAQQLFNFGNSSLRNYNRSFGDAADMAEMLYLEPEVKDPQRPEKLRIAKGQIEFSHVDFTHEGAGEALFHNLCLKIQPGEKVGLVGHSGSGKTTFMRLLLRFSDIDGGEILIDGQNIANIKQDDLRSKLAYVPQEPIMFHRSLAENISYGHPNSSRHKIVAAAKLAHADEFIESLPERYETLVGERGIKLSGGQRQRIAIARAMLKEAPILVLDEATSALDSESERLIQDALRTLMKNKTTIVIAHRLSTIQKMDRIIVLEDGAIVEEGSHKQLLERGGTYAQLWAHQSGGFIDE